MSWKFPHYEVNQPLNWPVLLATYPWIADMAGVPQDPVWHAEGDVLTHTRLVVEALIAAPEFATLTEADKHIMVTAALLHDVEKRSTTTTEVIDGAERIVAPRHAKKGEFTARRLLYTDLPTPFATRERICKLVRLHGLPLWAIERPDPVRTVVRASLSVDTRLLAMLARADVRGRHCDDADDLLLRIDLFEELCREHACFGQPRAFASDQARYHYLNRPDAYLEYVPYDQPTCTVHMLAGLPGSGKDTYLQRHLANLPVVSIDDLRRANGVAPTDKKGNGRMVQLAKEAARVELRAGRDFVFNATNLTTMMRRRWTGLFTEYGAAVRLVYLEVPYRELLRRNRARMHPVPVGVLERMIGGLEVPGVEEAWSVEFFVGAGSQVPGS